MNATLLEDNEWPVTLTRPGVFRPVTINATAAFECGADGDIYVTEVTDDETGLRLATTAQERAAMVADFRAELNRRKNDRY